MMFAKSLNNTAPSPTRDQCIARVKAARARMGNIPSSPKIVRQHPNTAPLPPPPPLPIPEGKPRVILDAVAEHAGWPLGIIISPSRNYTHAYWRALAVLLLHRHTTLSSVQIGKIFTRDHSTILHAIKRAEQHTKPHDLAAIEAMIAEPGEQ
jgi:hypothetical protein